MLGVKKEERANELGEVKRQCEDSICVVGVLKGSVARRGNQR